MISSLQTGITRTHPHQEDTGVCLDLTDTSLLRASRRSSYPLKGTTFKRQASSSSWLQVHTFNHSRTVEIALFLFHFCSASPSSSNTSGSCDLAASMWRGNHTRHGRGSEEGNWTFELCSPLWEEIIVLPQQSALRRKFRVMQRHKVSYQSCKPKEYLYLCLSPQTYHTLTFANGLLKAVPILVHWVPNRKLNLKSYNLWQISLSLLPVPNTK